MEIVPSRSAGGKRPLDLTSLLHNFSRKQSHLFVSQKANPTRVQNFPISRHLFSVHLQKEHSVASSFKKHLFRELWKAEHKRKRLLSRFWTHQSFEEFYIFYASLLAKWFFFLKHYNYRLLHSQCKRLLLNIRIYIVQCVYTVSYRTFDSLFLFSSFMHIFLVRLCENVNVSACRRASSHTMKHSVQK